MKKHKLTIVIKLGTRKALYPSILIMLLSTQNDQVPRHHFQDCLIPVAFGADVCPDMWPSEVD